MALKRRNQKSPLVPENLPRHVAVIMDGNGRWAQKRLLPRVAGHTAGMSRVKSIMTRSAQLGIGYLTLYAFSTENWKRPREEVSFLMNLVVEYMKKELQAMHELNIRVRTLGDITVLPQPVADVLNDAVEYTAGNTGLTVVLALNYGGRSEIAAAGAELARRCVQGELRPEDIDEDVFAGVLETADIPDPDLIIRTSGEQRMSNFLLFQLAYAELYFTPVLWPDFDEEEYDEALRVYQQRNRRYGRI